MIKMQGFWFGRANYNIIPTALLAEFKPCVKEIGVNWDEENQGFSIRANSHRTYNFYSNERYHCDRFYPSVRNVCKNQHQIRNLQWGVGLSNLRRYWPTIHAEEIKTKKIRP